MNNVMIVAGAAALALLFVEFVTPQLKWWVYGELMHKKRLKPFDCDLCMGFWLSVVGFSINYFRKSGHVTIYTLAETAIVGATSAILAAVISKYLNT